jgi:hypothetical protein
MESFGAMRSAAQATFSSFSVVVFLVTQIVAAARAAFRGFTWNLQSGDQRAGKSASRQVSEQSFAHSE